MLVSVVPVYGLAHFEGRWLHEARLLDGPGLVEREVEPQNFVWLLTGGINDMYLLASTGSENILGFSAYEYLQGFDAETGEACGVESVSDFGRGNALRLDWSYDVLESTDRLPFEVTGPVESSPWTATDDSPPTLTPENGLIVLTLFYFASTDAGVVRATVEHTLTRVE